MSLTIHLTIWNSNRRLLSTKNKKSHMSYKHCIVNCCHYILDFMNTDVDVCFLSCCLCVHNIPDWFCGCTHCWTHVLAFYWSIAGVLPLPVLIVSLSVACCGGPCGDYSENQRCNLYELDAVSSHELQRRMHREVGADCLQCTCSVWQLSPAAPVQRGPGEYIRKISPARGYWLNLSK